MFNNKRVEELKCETRATFRDHQQKIHELRIELTALKSSHEDLIKIVDLLLAREEVILRKLPAKWELVNKKKV